MLRGFSVAVAVGSALVLAAGSSAGGAAGTSCDTHGLAFKTGAKPSYRVVNLLAQGIDCSRARAVALRVGTQLAQGKPLELSGTQGVSLSEVASCSPSCTSMTKVALTYPRGTITVTLRHVATGAPAPAASPPASGTVI